MKSKAALLLLLLAVAPFSRAASWKIAQPGYQYQFPRDFFNHPGYRTEWWYYTGNLRAPDGHRFGFELTFFRQGISLQPNTSPWYVHNVYMAHLALSDISGRHYYHTERINRGGPGIAGIDAQKDLVWNGNWQAHLDSHSQELQAAAENFGVHLRLVPAKPVVIQGRNGISQKAAGAGHASHYFSLTRLLTSGTVRIHGTIYRVEGTSWMDHEFFTSSMAPDESGWDWVGLQLGDNTELMLYRMRLSDGSVDPFSSGSYVDAHGKSTFLSSRDFTMTPESDTWTSPQTKGRYPLRWHISVPSLGLELEVTTPLPDQELISRVGPSYWEGTVSVTGQHLRKAVRGVGYLEMTGYAAAGIGNL